MGNLTLRPPILDAFTFLQPLEETNAELDHGVHTELHSISTAASPEEATELRRGLEDQVKE